MWKHAGFSYALIWLLDRVLYRFGFHIFIVSIHDREWVLGIPPPRIPPYELRWATPEEVRAATADAEPEWMELPRVSAALDKGERCTAAFLEGRMVSCTWSARSGPLCKGLTINVPPTCVYGHEAKTRAGHRGRGLYAALVLTSARAAGEAGKEMVGYVYAGNTRAVSGSARMGKKKAGFVVCKEGKRPRAWVSPVCRKAGIWVSQRQ